MKKNYQYTPDEYFKNLYSTYSSPYKEVRDIPTAEKISDNIKEKLRISLGIDNIPYKCSKPSIKTVKTEKRKSCTIETLSLEICNGMKMLCYVLIPENGSKSGIAALCGHGYGARQIIRQSKRGKYRIINFLDSYQKNFALELAANGHTVIVPEFVGFGEARLKKDIHKPFYASSCDTLAHHSLIFGFSVAAIRVYQTMKCIDLLTERYSCSEIGCMGISGGGLVALYTSCLDERIKKVCVCGYINTFKNSVLDMWHCPDNYIPGLLQVGEMYDFASTLAPRKLMMECGENDRLFPITGSKTAIEKISSVYKLFGAEENFTPVIFNGKHEVSLDSALKFFSL